MLLQLLFVLIAIIIGARLGGIGLGVLGGLGLAILTFVFGLEPTSPPIDVMLMIVAVIAAASCMQAAGGLDLMVKWAEKLLRKNPSKITLLSPLVTYIFTFIAGTGHVAYSVLPVIAEVATETKIRPERPLGIAVIASQQAITASPISAATVALLSMLSGHNISLMDILMISVPCTLKVSWQEHSARYMSERNWRKTPNTCAVSQTRSSQVINIGRKESKTIMQPSCR